MTEAEQKAAALLDVLGVRLDPGIVWDAVGFTFLVDWVVDVSGFLHSLARDNFPIQVQVRDFCHSVSYHSEHEISVYAAPSVLMNPKPPWPPLDGALVHGVYNGSRSSYSRTVYSPDLHRLDTTRRIRLRQLGLSGSLLFRKSPAWVGEARSRSWLPLAPGGSKTRRTIRQNELR
jgi:hypothetical protein